MKGLRYVIALFHVSLIARANIENINPVIIIVIVVIVVIIVIVIVIIAIVVIKMVIMSITIAMIYHAYRHIFLSCLFDCTHQH